MPLEDVNLLSWAFLFLFLRSPVHTAILFQSLTRPFMAVRRMEQACNMPVLGRGESPGPQILTHDLPGCQVRKELGSTRSVTGRGLLRQELLSPTLDPAETSKS